MSLLDRLQDGKEHAVTQVEYYSFLDVLPPVCLATDYQGRRWDFGFAEGADHVYLFRKARDGWFAVKTPFLNPFEAGSFENQKDVGSLVGLLWRERPRPFKTSCCLGSTRRRFVRRRPTRNS